MYSIANIHAHEILDSRGSPTLNVSVNLADGISANASVPSGASTGVREAVELRDGDPARYGGRGVLKAAANVCEVISPHLRGMAVTDQAIIDLALQRLDGTANKSRLGSNAVLGVSFAVARAAALAKNLPLYTYIAQLCGEARPLNGDTPYLMPAPMITLLNGGTHANNRLDVQEFMVLPLGALTFAEAVRCGSAIFQSLKTILGRRGFMTAIGDAGGFAPNLKTPDLALDLIVEAILAAGYQPGKDVAIALDMAASELFHHNGYAFRNGNRSRKSAEQLIELYQGWLTRYPIVSIEDGLGENDRDGWKELTRTLGGKIQLVGDDFFATNPRLIARGIKDGIANAVLIKPNQVGTLSETLEAIRRAREAGYATVISGRSGETEDTFIADLAAGTSAGQIKTGSLCRCERTAKYNRLLAIERELGAYAVYGGKLMRKNGNGGCP